jgi:hypothetical protein
LFFQTLRWDLDACWNHSNSLLSSSLLVVFVGLQHQPSTSTII